MKNEISKYYDFDLKTPCVIFRKFSDKLKTCQAIIENKDQIIKIDIKNANSFFEKKKIETNIKSIKATLLNDESILNNKNFKEYNHPVRDKDENSFDFLKQKNSIHFAKNKNMKFLSSDDFQLLNENLKGFKSSIVEDSLIGNKRVFSSDKNILEFNDNDNHKIIKTIHFDSKSNSRRLERPEDLIENTNLQVNKVVSNEEKDYNFQRRNDVNSHRLSNKNIKDIHNNFNFKIKISVNPINDLISQNELLLNNSKILNSNSILIANCNNNQFTKNENKNFKMNSNMTFNKDRNYIESKSPKNTQIFNIRNDFDNPIKRKKSNKSAKQTTIDYLNYLTSDKTNFIIKNNLNNFSSIDLQKQSYFDNLRESRIKARLIRKYNPDLLDEAQEICEEYKNPEIEFIKKPEGMLKTNKIKYNVYNYQSETSIANTNINQKSKTEINNIFENLFKNIEKTIKETYLKEIEGSDKIILINADEKIDEISSKLSYEKLKFDLDYEVINPNTVIFPPLKCFICEINLTPTELFGSTECNHHFCYFCGKIYFENKIEQKDLFFKCPYYVCSRLIHAKIIKDLISDQHFITILKTLNQICDNNDNLFENNLLVNNYFQSKEIIKNESNNECIKNENIKNLNQNALIVYDQLNIVKMNLLILQINKEKFMNFQNKFNNQKAANCKNPVNSYENKNYEIKNHQNEFQKNYINQNIIEFHSNQFFMEFNTIKEKFCRECNEPALFDRYGKNIMKCLNCLKVKCKFCFKEIDENHFKLTGFNYCKVFYRRTLKLKYEITSKSNSKIKNFFFSLLLYFIAYALLIATCVFYIKNILSKLIFGNHFTSGEIRRKKADRNLSVNKRKGIFQNVENEKIAKEINLCLNQKNNKINNLALDSNSYDNSRINYEHKKIIPFEFNIKNRNDFIVSNNHQKMISTIHDVSNKTQKTDKKNSSCHGGIYFIKCFCLYIGVVIFSLIVFFLSILLIPYYPLILNAYSINE